MPHRTIHRPLRIRPVRATSDPALRSAYRLLGQVFPREELTPPVAWKHSLDERVADVWTDLNWHLLVAEYRRRIVGVATGWYLGNVAVGLIGYIAVSDHARSFGIGPRLRWALRLAFERDARRGGRPLKALVGEVHNDNPWLRRLVGRGALALDLPYCQPPLRRTDRAIPLVLYYQALGAPRAALPVAEVRRLIYTIWRRAYRIRRPLEYAGFRAMLRALSGRIRVGRLPLRPTRPST